MLRGPRGWHTTLAVVLLALAAAPGAFRDPCLAEARLSEVPEPAISWDPQGYVCFSTAVSVDVDGDIEGPEWALAPWTETFVDIRGGDSERPDFRTRAKMLWDDEFFYVAAELEEPHLWGSLTDRDAVIYHDNDFEVFIDPDGDTHEYYELEVNALGTEWDLLLVRPYRDGGPAVDAWDIQGLRTAVQVSGTLNDPSDTDTGWTLEIAIPWTVLDDCAHRPCPPRDRDRWRMNFSRVQWKLKSHGVGYAKVLDPDAGTPLPEENWVWSPQGLVSMHYPEMWGFVEFWDLPAGASSLAFPRAAEPDEEERAAWALRLVYYRERNLNAATGRFTNEFSELGLDSAPSQGYSWPPEIHVTPNGFEASVTTGEGRRVRIDERGQVVAEPAR